MGVSLFNATFNNIKLMSWRPVLLVVGWFPVYYKGVSECMHSQV